MRRYAMPLALLALVVVGGVGPSMSEASLRAVQICDEVKVDATVSTTHTAPFFGASYTETAASSMTLEQVFRDPSDSIPRYDPDMTPKFNMTSVSGAYNYGGTNGRGTDPETGAPTVVTVNPYNIPIGDYCDLPISGAPWACAEPIMDFTNHTFLGYEGIDPTNGERTGYIDGRDNGQEYAPGMKLLPMTTDCSDPIPGVQTFLLQGNANCSYASGDVQTSEWNLTVTRHLPDDMSDAGKTYTKCQEGPPGTHCGPALYAYDDTVRACTVGWGHKLVPQHSCTQADYRRYGTKRKHKLTLADAQQLFDHDVQVHAQLWLHHLQKDTPVNQCQYDALTDFAFNSGLAKYPGLRKILQEGTLGNIPEYITVKGLPKNPTPVLLQRRAHERAVFGGECACP